MSKSALFVDAIDCTKFVFNVLRVNFGPHGLVHGETTMPRSARLDAHRGSRINVLRRSAIHL